MVANYNIANKEDTGQNEGGERWEKNEKESTRKSIDKMINGHAILMLTGVKQITLISYSRLYI